MKKLLLASLFFVSCEKESECYLCEKSNQSYRYCEEDFYSPSISFDEMIESMRQNGYDCDYYID